VVPKDPVEEGVPNVIAEHREHWVNPTGLGWCRVAGTNDSDGQGEEPRIIEELATDERSSDAVSLPGVAPKDLKGGMAPTAPSLVDEQMKDPDVAPILELLSKSPSAPTSSSFSVHQRK